MQASRLAWYQRTAAGWHKRHTPFDAVMQKLLKQIKPEMLDDPTILADIPALEPFPYWEDTVA
jgi:hypothetical protein